MSFTATFLGKGLFGNVFREAVSWAVGKMSFFNQYMLKDSENNHFLLSRATVIFVLETNTVNFESKIFFQRD